MEIIKNLTVLDNTSEGLGVCKSKDMVIFVENALVGDIIDVKLTKKNKKFYNGKVLKYVKKSDFRNDLYKGEFYKIYPFINLKYEKELEIKKNIFLNNLKKIAKINLEDIEIIKNDSEFNYRNKIELKVDENYKLCYCTEIGEKIEIINCPVTDISINNFLKKLEEKLFEFKIKAYDFKKDTGILKNISIRSNYKGEIILTFVVKEISSDIIKCLNSLKNIENLIATYVNINKRAKSLVMDKDTKLIFKKKEFIDIIGKYKFNISPRSFFQVNKFQTEKLYNLAKEFLEENKDKTLLDLYSGIGTTSIYFLENFKKVIGVEVVKDSIKDAKENKNLNNLKNIDFIYGKSEEKIEEILKKEKIDIISLDPPRKGLDKKVIDIISKSYVKKIVYISCNSATFSRDLKLFIDFGFNLKKIKLVDMFTKTPSMETVCLLEKS